MCSCRWVGEPNTARLCCVRSRCTEGRALSARSPGRSATGLAVAALLGTAAANAHHLAWWCLPLLVIASAWHARASLRADALPGRGARVGLTLIVTCGVLLSYRTLNGLSAGATLLAAMSAAKLLCRSWHLVPLMLAEVPMAEVSTTGHEAETEALASDELLVEEVSIDGMCGVY